MAPFRFPAMRFNDIKDIFPEGASPAIADMWAWAAANPDQDLPEKEAGAFAEWRTRMEELQLRAADVWATIHDLAPPPGPEEISQGNVVFPGYFGAWWVEVISYFVWDERLEVAIQEAEQWVASNVSVPT